MPSAFVIDTGVANIASMRVALDRLDIQNQLTVQPSDVACGDLVILPGVGSFRAGIDRLRELQLDKPVIERIAAGKPTLAVCLGMQMLCESSDESPGVQGLGILPVKVSRFQAPQKIPQLGWNEVLTRCSGPVDSGYAYFANSYCIEQQPPGWDVAKTVYGCSFVSAAWRDRVLACQFHPELSGRWGLALMRRWADGEQIDKPVTSSESTPC